MVDEQIRRRGVEDERVLRAMEEVPRHLFVPEDMREDAYGDFALPVGWGQTISQPYIVALMTSLLDLEGDEKVLEIGTGTGYQAAILSRLAREVLSVEVRAELARAAQARLRALGCANLRIRVGDGYAGWAEEAPFDGILVTAAPERVPQALVEQLHVGRRLIVPVGTYNQDLLAVTRTPEGMTVENVLPVRFVPLVHGSPDWN